MGTPMQHFGFGGPISALCFIFCKIFVKHRRNSVIIIKKKSAVIAEMRVIRQYTFHIYKVQLYLRKLDCFYSKVLNWRNLFKRGNVLNMIMLSYQ